MNEFLLPRFNEVIPVPRQCGSNLLPQDTRINCEYLHKVQTSLPALQYTNHYRDNGFASCSTTNLSLLSKSVGDWSLCNCYLVHSQAAKCGEYVGVLPPCLSVINPHDILQNRRIKRELANKDENVAKEHKVITLEVKFK